MGYGADDVLVGSAALLVSVLLLGALVMALLDIYWPRAAAEVRALLRGVPTR